MDTTTTVEPLPSQKLIREWSDAFATSLELDLIEGDPGEAALTAERAQLADERAQLADERAQLERERAALMVLRAEMTQQHKELEAEHRKVVDGLRHRLTRTTKKLVLATKWLRETQAREAEPTLIPGTPPSLDAVSPAPAIEPAKLTAPVTAKAAPRTGKSAPKPKQPPKAPKRAKGKAPRRRSIGRRRF